MAHNGSDPGEKEPLGVYWYEFRKGASGPEWIRHIIDYGGRMGAGMQIPVVDVDGDGDLDLVCPGKSGLVLRREPDEAEAVAGQTSRVHRALRRLRHRYLSSACDLSRTAWLARGSLRRRREPALRCCPHAIAPPSNFQQRRLSGALGPPVLLFAWRITRDGRRREESLRACSCLAPRRGSSEPPAETVVEAATVGSARLERPWPSRLAASERVARRGFRSPAVAVDSRVGSRLTSGLARSASDSKNGERRRATAQLTELRDRKTSGRSRRFSARQSAGAATRHGYPPHQGANQGVAFGFKITYAGRPTAPMRCIRSLAGETSGSSAWNLIRV